MFSSRYLPGHSVSLGVCPVDYNCFQQTESNVKEVKEEESLMPQDALLGLPLPKPVLARQFTCELDLFLLLNLPHTYFFSTFSKESLRSLYQCILSLERFTCNIFREDLD